MSEQDPIANLVSLDESLKYLGDRLRAALEDVTESLAAVATLRGTVGNLEPGEESGPPVRAVKGTRFVLIRDIAVSPDRPDPDPRELTNLAASIESNGQREPVVVRPDPDHPDGYRLIHGRRQLAALKLIHREVVKVLIADEG